jgi:hypothetical protein
LYLVSEIRIEAINDSSLVLFSVKMLIRILIWVDRDVLCGVDAMVVQSASLDLVVESKIESRMLLSADGGRRDAY